MNYVITILLLLCIGCAKSPMSPSVVIPDDPQVEDTIITVPDTVTWGDTVYFPTKDTVYVDSHSVTNPWIAVGSAASFNRSVTFYTSDTSWTIYLKLDTPPYMFKRS